MQYSKQITDYAHIYGLMPQDVFFAMLVAAGANRSEAFAIIFRPSSASQMAAAKGASTLCQDKPNINHLIEIIAQNRGFTNPAEDTTNDQDTTTPGGRRKGGGEKEGRKKFRNKVSVLEGLEGTLPELRGKDRADVLMKIADLQQMKKDENTEEVKRVHYYLPLRCNYCSFFQRRGTERKEE